MLWRWLALILSIGVTLYGFATSYGLAQWAVSLACAGVVLVGLLTFWRTRQSTPGKAVGQIALAQTAYVGL